MKKSNARYRTEHTGDTKVSKVNGSIEHGALSSETQDFAQLVWKYFESEIREVLQQITEDLAEQQQAETK